MDTLFDILMDAPHTATARIGVCDKAGLPRGIYEGATDAYARLPIEMYSAEVLSVQVTITKSGRVTYVIHLDIPRIETRYNRENWFHDLL